MNHKEVGEKLKNLPDRDRPNGWLLKELVAFLGLPMALTESRNVAGKLRRLDWGQKQVNRGETKRWFPPEHFAFTCGFCNKPFASTQALQNHIHVHKAERRVCVECQERDAIRKVHDRWFCGSCEPTDGKTVTEQPEVVEEPQHDEQPQEETEPMATEKNTAVQHVENIKDGKLDELADRIAVLRQSVKAKDEEFAVIEDNIAKAQQRLDELAEAMTADRTHIRQLLADMMNGI